MSTNKVVATKENTAIVMAEESGYSHNGYVKAGYKVFCAYNHVGIILRCVRELCFKICFLPKTVWYDKHIIDANPEFIIIKDAIITRAYLLWLQKRFPQAQINFMYENMIGKAKHIRPSDIPSNIRIWTYDKYDSEKYGIRLKHTMQYFSEYVLEKGEIEYDVLFVGRDKGRGDWLHRFDGFLQEKGFRTKFIITKDRRYSKNKTYYQKEVPYETIAKWIAHTRCIINVGMENQQGITVRDLECLFNRIKMITTNEHIKDVYFYKPNNIFVLNSDNWEAVPAFLESAYDDSVIINDSIHSVSTMIEEMTC